MLYSLYNFIDKHEIKKDLTYPETMEFLANISYEDSKIDNQQTLLFNYIKQNKKALLHEPLPDDKIDDLIGKFYFPNKKGDVAFFYEGFPEQETWRLFVDLKKQKDPKENGFVGYESREKGCIQDMYDANEYIKATMETSLTPDYIRNIHRIVAAHCQSIITYSGWGNEHHTPIEPGEFKASAFGHITMDKSWISPLGYLQMKKDFGTIYKNFYVDLRFPKQGYAKVIEEVIQQYEQQVAEDAPRKKLKAIVRFVQTLDRLHPFKDANTRTFLLLILNRELKRHGFSPTLVEDPNRLEGFSRKEALIEILCGMQNFKKLKEGHPLPGCKPTTAILNENHPYPIQFKAKKLVAKS